MSRLHTRRSNRLAWGHSLVLGCLLLGGLTLTAGPAVAGEQAAGPVAYGDIFQGSAPVKLAAGVYAFISPESLTAIVNSNSLVVIGDTGVLVVDAGNIPSVTRARIAEIRKLTDKPVRYLVTTHWHFDHVAGSAEFRAAWPNVEIISTTATRELNTDKFPANITLYTSDLPGIITSMKGALTSGRRSDGTPLPDAARKGMERDLHDYERMVTEIGGVRYAPATLTFDQTMTIHLGARDVQLLFLGRGNTAGDAVVYVPDAKAIATGDLVVAPTPFGHGAYMFDWPATLQRLVAIDATTIVPGHGAVQHDWAYARLVERLVASIGVQMQAAVAKGLSAEDARKALDVGELRTAFTGGDPVLVRAFNSFFLEEASDRAFREAMLRAEK